MANIDDITVLCDFPDGFKPDPNEGFQTHDLGLEGKHYTITKDNILLRVVSNRNFESPDTHRHVPFSGQLDLFYMGHIDDKDDLREYSFYLKDGIVISKIGNLFEKGVKSICQFSEGMSGAIQSQVRKDYDY